MRTIVKGKRRTQVGILAVLVCCCACGKTMPTSPAQLRPCDVSNSYAVDTLWTVTHRIAAVEYHCPPQ